VRRLVAQNRQLAGTTQVELNPEAAAALQEGIAALEAGNWKRRRHASTAPPNCNPAG
jgi:hypothetical protein